ncbi:hypothetical protein PCANC_17550 [Puccinia coronata f. sp. avenae]|uniref:Uncharacterized protein n=1 Tax=Puccinia coronata f. sp. avenae TaxID=200324 RepID=A0A2N5U137_9BASI|nr:hypothetical protein PCANC_17550 [Puccinia coronata f. sp. avenae]
MKLISLVNHCGKVSTGNFGKTRQNAESVFRSFPVQFSEEKFSGEVFLRRSIPLEKYFPGEVFLQRSISPEKYSSGEVFLQRSIPLEKYFSGEVSSRSTRTSGSPVGFLGEPVSGRTPPRRTHSSWEDSSLDGVDPDDEEDSSQQQVEDQSYKRPNSTQVLPDRLPSRLLPRASCRDALHPTGIHTRVISCSHNQQTSPDRLDPYNRLALQRIELALL